MHIQIPGFSDKHLDEPFGRIFVNPSKEEIASVKAEMKKEMEIAEWESYLRRTIPLDGVMHRLDSGRIVDIVEHVCDDLAGELVTHKCVELMRAVIQGDAIECFDILKPISQKIIRKHAEDLSDEV